MSQALKSGGRGEAVAALQRQLAKLRFDVPPDGVFGPGTRAAIEELQALFGYDIDGMVGAEMHELIDEQTELGFDVRDATGTVRSSIARDGNRCRNVPFLQLPDPARRETS